MYKKRTNFSLVMLTILMSSSSLLFSAPGSFPQADGTTDADRLAQLKVENKKLRTREQNRKFADTGLGLYKFGKWFTDDYSHRKSKDENKEEYNNNLAAAVEYQRKTGDEKLVKEIQKKGYKKSWADRNPGVYNFVVWPVGAVACISVIAKLIKR